MRTIDWIDNSVVIVDQTALPAALVADHITTHEGLIAAIKRLAVRGAPALGVAGALGVALIARDPRMSGDRTAALAAALSLERARPTAVNLSWGVHEALAMLGDGPDAVLRRALDIRDQEISNSSRMGERGRALIESLLPGPVNVMTICNTGALATVERGTALSVVRSLDECGLLGEVLPLETRPLLQGARLTAWELKELGIRYRVIIDSAGPFLLQRGAADVVIVGADRIAANGDTANKIGTYSLAVAAAANSIPFIVVAPESTIDMATATGAEIEIEDRGPAEVVSFNGGAPTAPDGSETINPAFDLTPASLITAIVTERRVIRVDRGERPNDEEGLDEGQSLTSAARRV